MRADAATNKLFITFKSRRWINNLLSVSKLLRKSTPHSCRAASTSKAKMVYINIEYILKLRC